MSTLFTFVLALLASLAGPRACHPEMVWVCPAGTLRGVCWLTLLLALGPLWTPAALSAEPAPAPGFELIARTSHIDYFVAKGRRVDVRRTEAFLDRLSSLFRLPPEGWRIQYYRHPSVGELSDHVGYAVSGVADLATGRIDSAREFHPHELVHAMMGRLGLPPAFFAEGLAVALTSRGRWRGHDPDEIAAREMAARGSLEPFLVDFGEQDPLVAYAVAGSFVAFLLDRQGIEAMEVFLRGCGDSPSRYERAFRRAYGRSVASLTIEWMAQLRRGETNRPRAWYDPARWPAALQRGIVPPAPQAAMAGPAVARPLAEPAIGGER